MTSDLRVRATRSSIASLLAQLAQTAVGAGSFALMASQLGPSDYGIYGMATTAVGLVGTVGDGGMLAAVTRKPVVDATVEASAWWISMAVGAVLCLFGLVAAPFVSWFYANPRIAPIAAASAAIFVLNAPQFVSRAKLSKQLAFYRLSVGAVLGSVAGAAAGYGVARWGGGAWSLVVLTLANVVVQTVLLNVWSPVSIAWKNVSRTEARDLGKFGQHLSTFNLAMVIAQSSYPILVGRYLGATSLGVLTSAMALMAIPTSRVAANLSTVFLPTIVALPDIESKGRAFSSVTQLAVMLLAPVSFGVVAVGAEIPAVVPARWGALAPALQVAALGYMADPIGWLAFSAVQAEGRTGALPRVAVSMVPLSWLIAAVGVYLGSPLWVLAGWGTVNWVGAVIMVALLWRRFGLGAAYLRMVCAPIVGAAGMALAVRVVLHLLAMEKSRRGLAVGIATGAVVYVGYVLIVLRDPARRIVGLLGRALGASKNDAPATPGTTPTNP